MAVHRVSTDREAERRVRSLRRRFTASLGILVGIGVASTASLVILGSPEDGAMGSRVLLAFWDTINLVSTVGSLHEDLSLGQRLWASFVIIFGLGAVLYAYGNLQGLLHGEDVRRHVGRIRMAARFAAFEGHVVVAGFGGVGESVARDLTRGGTRAVIIESDADRASAADDAGFDVLHGDATDEDVLAEAGIERAAGLVAVLGDDAPNTFLVLLARERAPRLRIVARAARDSTRSSLRRAGADRVIVPGQIAGVQMSHLIRKPRVSDFIAAAIGDGEYEFGEIAVSDHEWLRDRTLAELALPSTRGLLVISILKPDGTTVFSPDAGQRLAEEDVLLVVTGNGGLEAALKIPPTATLAQDSGSGR